MSLEQPNCKKCGIQGEYKISGPAAKNPGRLYWVCPQCPSKDGKGSLFIEFGPENNPKPEPPVPATKKQKVELPRPRIEEPMPTWAKILMEKTDLVLAKFERVLQLVEPQEELPEEPWEEMSSQKHMPNYIV